MILSSYYKGLLAELYVMLFLLLKGYIPIKWRMRNHISEIDLIFWRFTTIIAVEVKFRRDQETALLSLKPAQIEKIRGAFQLFCQFNHKTQSMRCDVCVVMPNLRIVHLINAF